MNPRWILVNRDSNRVLIGALQIADTYFSRLIGLLGHERLLQGHGLLLVPCSSVHTFAMAFPIDVVMLGRDGRVLSVRRDLKPWRTLAAARGTYAIVELPAGSADVACGDQLELEWHPDNLVPPPTSVAFLCPARRLLDLARQRSPGHTSDQPSISA